MTTPPRATIFGAGAIGLAFLGDLFDRSGYHVTYLDVRDDILQELRARGRYEIRIVQRGASWRRTIRDVDAINSGAFAKDAAVRETVTSSLAGADLIFTAAGERALPFIAPVLAAGLARRFAAAAAAPVNVVCCENVEDPAAVLREGLTKTLGEAAWQRLEPRVGLARSVISRMTPVVRTLEDITTEAYDEIPIEGAAWRGPAPDVCGLRLVENFPAYKYRKLIMHNMTHAVAAYLGWFFGKRDLGECMQEERVAAVTRRAMAEAVAIMVAEFGLPRAEQLAHGEDLLRRYDNPALGHTTANVGRDPLRKLGAHDRMMTAFRLAEKHKLPCDAILFGIALALNYPNPNDAEAQELQRRLQSDGLPVVLQQVSGIAPAEPAAGAIAAQYEKVRAALQRPVSGGASRPCPALQELVEAFLRARG